MNCVCGCPKTAHQTIPASVPLTNPNPLYPLTHTYANNIAKTNPRATYTIDQCGCGCTIYESDG